MDLKCLTDGIVETIVQDRSLDMSKRRTFTADFKAKMVLAILSGERTAAEISREQWDGFPATVRTDCVSPGALCRGARWWASVDNPDYT